MNLVDTVTSGLYVVDTVASGFNVVDSIAYAKVK
jgi:hypothetical protein